MIIIRNTQDGSLFFAASQKVVPGLVHELQGGRGTLEITIEQCEYFEFNSREERTGQIGPFVPLSNLVVVNCGLAPQDDEEEEASNAE